jgi:hypothetical protein
MPAAKGSARTPLGPMSSERDSPKYFQTKPNMIWIPSVDSEIFNFLYIQVVFHSWSSSVQAFLSLSLSLGLKFEKDLINAC